MQRPRHHLACVAAACVLFQLAAYAAAPIVLSAETLSDAATAARCTCVSGAPGAACPMHRGHGDAEDSGPDGKLRSGCASSDIALLSLAGSIGVVPSPRVTVVDCMAALLTFAPISAPSRCELPESPPPRT